MSDEIGTYSFLPYLRQGVANNIEPLSDPTIKRGQITVTLKVDGNGLTDPGPQTIPKVVEIYGPGDVVGIDAKAIIKTEPHNWITNFEPNYFPFIDFYDEDFVWRYTPTSASNERLKPWLTLAVLTEDEFDDGTNILNKPLNYITLKEGIDPVAVFPPKDDLWAWAHVHIDRNIVGEGDDPISSDEPDFINKFKAILAENPDLAHSRLVSPRKLAESEGYHAFLIPTFESGRLAGLGINPDEVTDFGTETISWETYTNKQAPKDFPYYYRWYFRTSTVGDFEYLVRLLEPKVADSRVGRRDIDVLAPDSGIDGIDDERLKGILRLGGALQFPVECLQGEEAAEYENYDHWYDAYPHKFQKQMATFINLADEYATKPTADAHTDAANNADLDIEDDNPDDPDPLVTPPLYGRWHALTSRLLFESDGSTPVANNQNWVHELNLDPRWRTATNFGTNVIQDKQEEYMDAAWEQVGDVLEANRQLNWSVLATLVSKVWYQHNIKPKQGIALEYYLKLTTPIQKRVMSGGKTVFYHVKNSLVPKALISAPMRRIIRPRGRLIKNLDFNSSIRRDNLVSRVNANEVTPSPPREVPDDLLTHTDISDSVKPDYVPKFLLDLLSRYPWIQYLPLLIGFLIILFMLIAGLGGTLFAITASAVTAISLALFIVLRRLTRDVNNAESILPEEQTPASVDELPNSPDFHITEIDDPFVPQTGTTDSPEARRFKSALRDNFDFVQQSAEAGKPPVYTALNISAAVNDLSLKLNPEITIPRYSAGRITIPGRIVDGLKENFKAAMAYPEIDTPMYEPLLGLSDEHFVPNINLIEPNSITLLETNQRFIEAYMVGINHEFARELLWREYPTDQRGSYFRQFWDVSSFINKDNLDDEAFREKLYDIPKLHRWSRFSNLGDHDHREEGGDKENEVVLVIRGELLKKYPTAVIYAHRAKWILDNDGNPDLTKPRDFDDTEPPESVVKSPLYEAKVDPDIYFFGFDLDVVEAKGDGGETPDNPGWFFVIKERPGEPRFGFDVPGDSSDFEANQVGMWNDLAWSHVVENPDAGAFVSIKDTRTITVPDSSAGVEDEEQAQQIREDSHVQWSNGMNAAELAYILYQVPVLMGVHAVEMLPDKCGNSDEG